jgi:hypothetical protein
MNGFKPMEAFMQKVLKRIVLALTLCLAVICASAFTVGCGGGEDASGYTVTVLYPNGNAVDGTKDGTAGTTDTQVQVQLCFVDTAGVTGTCYTPVGLGSDGKATITDLPDLNSGEKYHVILRGIPTGYTYNEETYMDAPGSITITLVAKAA